MAKSSKGIYKRGNYYWLSYKDSSGKIVRESSGATKLRDAEAILTERKHVVLEKKEPAVKKIKNVTYKELIKECHETFAIKKSYSVDKHVLDQLSREFGNLMLTDFSADMIESFQVKITTRGLDSFTTRGKKDGARPCTPATANKLVGVLKRTFTKAYKAKYCSEEKYKEVRSVKLLSVDKYARKNYLNHEQYREILTACDASNDTKYLKPLIIFAVNTGCRKSEILSLKWSDVDLNHAKRIYIRTSKNGESKEVPINNGLEECLKGIVPHKESKYVFCDADGNKFGDIRKTFYKVCRRIGLTDFHFHDLRHTYASHLVMANVNLTTVAKLMGHKTLAMTMRYAHLAPNFLDTAVSMLDSRINPLALEFATADSTPSNLSAYQ